MPPEQWGMSLYKIFLYQVYTNLAYVPPTCWRLNNYKLSWSIKTYVIPYLVEKEMRLSSGYGTTQNNTSLSPPLFNNPSSYLPTFWNTTSLYGTTFSSFYEYSFLQWPFYGFYCCRNVPLLPLCYLLCSFSSHFCRYFSIFLYILNFYIVYMYHTWCVYIYLIILSILSLVFLLIYVLS